MRPEEALRFWPPEKEALRSKTPAGSASPSKANLNEALRSGGQIITGPAKGERFVLEKQEKGEALWLSRTAAGSGVIYRPLPPEEESASARKVPINRSASLLPGRGALRSGKTGKRFSLKIDFWRSASPCRLLSPVLKLKTSPAEGSASFPEAGKKGSASPCRLTWPAEQEPAVAPPCLLYEPGFIPGFFAPGGKRFGFGQKGERFISKRLSRGSASF